MSKFSKFTKAGIALALVILTLLSTFTVALAVLLPEGANSSNGMNASGLLPFYYNSDTDSGWWYWKRTDTNVVMDGKNGTTATRNDDYIRKSVGNSQTPDSNTVNAWRLFPKGVNATTNADKDWNKSTYVRQYLDYDFTMDITQGNDPGWKAYKGSGALSKVYYYQTINKDAGSSFMQNSGTVVPGWRSGGDNTIFGKQFGDEEFTNVAQCVIQPANPEDSALISGNTISDASLYGIHNTSTRAKTFYYLTPQMTMTTDSNKKFNVQKMSEKDVITNKEVAAIGSSDVLSDEQLAVYKSILYEKFSYLYQTKSNKGRALLVMNELSPNVEYAYESGNHKLHVLGHYDEKGNYVVTYEDLLHFIAFGFYLTNDICDNSDDVLAGMKEGGWLWNWAKNNDMLAGYNEKGEQVGLGGYMSYKWGYVHATTPCDNVTVQGAHNGNDANTNTVSVNCTHERFNQNTIFQLQHAFMSWLSIGDKSGFDGHAVSNWSYGNPQYKDKGRDVDAWGGGFLLDILPVQYLLRTGKERATEEYNRGKAKYISEQFREKEIMKDIWVTLFYTLEEGKTYTVSTTNTKVKGPYMNPIPSEVVVFYYYPTNADKNRGRISRVDTSNPGNYNDEMAFNHKKNGEGNTTPSSIDGYTQVYVSSAIMRTPVIIHKEAEFDAVSEPDHIEYYSDYAPIRLKLYETSDSDGNVSNEVLLGDESGSARNNGTSWDTMVPDEWLDKENNAIKFTEREIEDEDGVKRKHWVAGLYLMRWGGYKSDAERAGKQYDASYYLKEFDVGGNQSTSRSFDMNLQVKTYDDSFADAGTGNVGTNTNTVKFQIGRGSFNYSNELFLQNNAKTTDFKFRKDEVDSDGDYVRHLRGAKFTLYERKEFYDLVTQSLEDGTTPTAASMSELLNKKQNQISGTGGEVHFEDVLFGDYILIEREGPKKSNAPTEPDTDFVLDHSPYSFNSIVNDIKKSGAYNETSRKYDDFDYDAFNKIDRDHVYNIDVLNNNGGLGTVKRYDVHSCKVVNGDATLSNFKVDNKRAGSVTIHKTGADGEALRSAYFKMYADSDFSTLVAYGSTDASGTLVFSNLEYGEYWLAETHAPKGYLIAPAYSRKNVRGGDANVIISTDERDISINVSDPPQEAGITLTKKLVSSDYNNNPNKTPTKDDLYEVPDGLVTFVHNDEIKNLYSYSSVRFTFYTSEEAARNNNTTGDNVLKCMSVNGDTSKTKAENLKLDEDGILNIKLQGSSGPKTYYYREFFDSNSHLHPMNNDGTYKDDDNKDKIYSVTLSGTADESVDVEHVNYVDRGSFIAFDKINAETKGHRSGAVFKLEFFDKQFASESEIGDTEPARVYYLGSGADVDKLSLYDNNGTLIGYNGSGVTTLGRIYANGNDLRNDLPDSKTDSSCPGSAIDNHYGDYFPEGSYRLTEVSTPAGYNPIDKVYFGNLTGNETGVIYIGEDDSDFDHKVIPNEPYVPIYIKKTDAKTGAKLRGAVFKLEYFEDTYSSASAIPETSEYTYYLRTNSSGFAYTGATSHYVNAEGSATDVVRATDLKQTGLPVYNGRFKRGGTYRVTEVKAPDGYKLSQNPVQWGIVSNNTITKETISGSEVTVVSLSYSNEKIPSIIVKGSKVWDDLHNATDRRPDGIRVELYRNGDLLDSQLLGNTETSNTSDVVWYDFRAFQRGENGDSQYNYSFTDLPEGYYDTDGNYVRYEYSIREVLLKLDSLPTAGLSSIGHLKELKDSPYTGLYQNSRAVVKSGGVQVYNQEIGNIATKQATATISGSNINWTVSDVPLGTTPLRVDIKNTYRPEPISVTVTKDWVDNGNQYQTRPSSIQVKLYRKWDASEYVDVDMSHPTEGILTEQVGSVYTISAANGWRLVIPELSEFVSELDGHKPSKDLGQYFDTNMSDFYQGGIKYEYYVEEVPVGNGYVTEQTDDLSLTNYETKNIVLEKRWNDRSNAANKRPTSVDFTLYREYVVPGYYTTNGESVTITKTVGTYTIDNFTNDKGSVKVTGQPVVASAFFDDKIAEDLGSRLGTDSDGKTFTAYETVGEHAIPCRYYVTESTVTGYDEPEYLDHTQATVQGVLTETIPVQNTYKVFDVVVKKYYRSSLPDNTSSLEAQLQGTKLQANVGFVLGAGSNGKNGVIKATGTNGVYEKQGAEIIDDIQNYFRARGSGVNKRILNTFADDSEYIMRTGSTGSNKGKLTIKNLEPGTYVILESTPVEKYSTSNVPVTFTLTDEGKIRVMSDGHPVDMDELVFVNDRIFAPKTGGTGNMIYYVAALLALSLGVFGVLFFRRRRIRSTIVK